MDDGVIEFRDTHKQNGKPVWTERIAAGAPRIPIDGFVSIGFAALGETVVCQRDGKYTSIFNDKRITVGSPGVRALGFDSDTAVYKDIEVFVPDKDSPVSREAAGHPGAQEKAGSAKADKPSGNAAGPETTKKEKTVKP